MRFKDKKAVIVGAAENSIGQGIARALAAEGARVCIWDINTESAGKTAKRIADAGGRAKVMKVNVLDYADVKKAVDSVVKEFGGIDFMIDTVGGGVIKPFKDFTPELFRQQVEFNGFSVFNCAHAVLGHFLEKNSGKMLFFTSTTGGLADHAGYGAGKAVLESLIKTMVTELSKTKININAIMPGVVPTPLTLGAMGMNEQQVREKWGPLFPRGLNTAEEVAKLALFLLSEEADRLTGQVIKSI